MRLRLALVLTLALALTQNAMATVFINEVLINPPGSLDDTREFIELMGTPGMKLDGYAIAVVNGYTQKFHNLGSISLGNMTFQEIDEFFSLDGLTLGSNGILVVAVGIDLDNPTVLADTSLREDWGGIFYPPPPGGPGMIWNGGRDFPGKIGNDGSTTVVLIRNRPGDTEATCPDQNCADLRWGKEICPDCELFTPVDANICVGGPVANRPCSEAIDCPMGSCMPGQVDQWGDGNYDKGQVNGLGGNTLDLKGASTLMDLSDDLEIVDEVSMEDARGWEYDADGRMVDMDATEPLKYPHREVHTLGDPEGFNPDCLIRVDYRTKGPGWDPAPGATGEYAGGTKNWQDNATDQWIRGDTVSSSGVLYLDNGANVDPNAIVPYRTHTPAWLRDGIGADYNYTMSNTYPVTSGRVNPLAIPFIPGDSDRDGDCDQDDISKIAAVFGDDNWIFSNSFSESAEGDSGDPALQTRPWDVDATGDNGIEASDLQWTLNFQGNTDGHIVGIRYDSTTPSATGVVLNPNTGVQCNVTASVAEACGRALNQVWIGSFVDVTVSVQVVSGSNMTAGSQNGVMQYVHDVQLSSGGVLQLAGIEPLGAFATTRSALESPQGAGGDLGVKRVNGYSTSFTQGLGSASQLYRVRFMAVAAGSTSITVSAASEAKFAASTPGGLKIGHTRNISVAGFNDVVTTSMGDPAIVNYPAAVGVTVVNANVADINADNSFDIGDIATFTDVLVGANTMPGPVGRSDLNCDGVRNGHDIRRFVELFFE